jgi:hypothetical protein
MITLILLIYKGMSILFFSSKKQIKNPEPLGVIPGKNYRENKKGIVSSAFLMTCYLLWLA